MKESDRCKLTTEAEAEAEAKTTRKATAKAKAKAKERSPTNKLKSATCAEIKGTSRWTVGHEQTNTEQGMRWKVQKVDPDAAKQFLFTTEK